MQISLLTLAAMALVLASWLMPLHILPWVSWHSEVPAFLAVLLLVLGGLTARIWRTRGTAVRVALPVSMLFWLALCLLVLSQWASGQIAFFGDGLVLCLYFTLCALAWGAGYVANQGDHGKEARQQSDLEAVAWTVLAGASASAVIAMVQAFDVWETASWINRMPQLRRPGGNIGQPNQLATLLIMGVASLLYLNRLQRLGQISSSIVFLLLAVGIAATESRTGVLSMALLLLWCLAERSRHGLGMRPWVAVAGFMLFLALLIGWPLLMSVFLQAGTEAKIDTRAGMRLVVWPQLIEAIMMHPWAGWGLREVSTAHNAVASNHAASEPYTYAHNIGLDLLLGVGLPLGILLLGLIGIWAWRHLRSVNDLRGWYCVAAVLPVATHSMLEFPFAYAYFLAPVMFLLGHLEALAGARAQLRINAYLVTIFVVLVSAVVFWSAVEYLQIEDDFRVVRFEALRVGKTPAEYQRPKVVLLTQLDALLEAARIEPRPGMAAEEIELTCKAAMRYPWTALQNRYALSLALNGQSEEAVRQLKVMRAQHGAKTYAEIRVSWDRLAREKHPQLSALQLP